MTSGPAVTALRPATKDGSMVAVILGRSRAAVLHVSTITRLNISSGCTWTPQLAALAAAAEPQDRALRAGMKLIARRARTRQDLADRLHRAGHDPAAISAALDHLQSLGLIDDARLARDLAAAHTRGRPSGAARAADALARRGISDDQADAAIRETFSGRDTLADALAAGRSRLTPSTRALAPAARARRIAAYLARRGFDEDTCADAVRRLVPDAHAD